VRVECKECRIGFNIPKDKVPDGRTARLLCPKCKAPIEIFGGVAPAELNGSSPYLPESESGLDSVLDYHNAIDIVDEGVRTALLCATDIKRAERIAQALQELDFWVVHALRPGFALGKLHHNHYDLVVLEENFNSGQDSANLVLHHIQLLPMHQRRQFFLCLLSLEKPTLDEKLAFRTGVNLILNLQDLEKTKVILARQLKQFRNFYNLFNAELAKKI
jgi:hypothetical protein